LSITADQIRSLRSRCSAAGLTRDEFAFALGVSTQTVVNWETDENVPNRQMRAILGVLRGANVRALRAAIKRQMDTPMSERASENRLAQLIADVAKR
jgi:DNA-binding XRE family transcriptional regulator